MLVIVGVQCTVLPFFILQNQDVLELVVNMLTLLGFPIIAPCNESRSKRSHFPFSLEDRMPWFWDLRQTQDVNTGSLYCRPYLYNNYYLSSMVFNTNTSTSLIVPKTSLGLRFFSRGRNFWRASIFIKIRNNFLILSLKCISYDLNQVFIILWLLK